MRDFDMAKTLGINDIKLESSSFYFSFSPWFSCAP